MHKDEAFLHSTANGALCQAIRCAYLTASRETADPKSAALTLLEAYLAAQATMITVLTSSGAVAAHGNARAFCSDFPCVASPFCVFGIAAGSPPSLRDGDLLRPHRSPYCLRARASGKSTEKCSRTCIHYYAEQRAIRAILTKSFKPSVQKPAKLKIKALCASGNGWSLPRPYIPIHRPAQASIAIAAANGALGREVQNARRSRTDRMENKPKNNKVWNVKKASVLQVKWLALDFPARGSGAGRGCSG